MREEERKGEEKGRRGEQGRKGEEEKRRKCGGGVVAVYKAIFPTELPTEINCCRCN
jgi:hypothetical protein